MKQPIYPAMAIVLALGACGFLTAVVTPVSPNDVAASEAALTAAEILARQYTQLPACPVGAPLCAAPATKATILADDNTAYAALQTLKTSSASGAPAALTAFQVALQAFQVAIPAQSASSIAIPATK